MLNLKRKLVIENFIENTTIHGISYINQKKKIHKIIWSVLMVILLCLLLLLTSFYLREYLKFESYIVHDERETDKLDGLPSVLICKTNELSIIKSIKDLNPELNKTFSFINKSVNFISSIKEYKTKSFNDQKLDQDFISNLKESSQLLFIDKCKMDIRDKTFDCTLLEKIILTFSGFCWLYDLNRLNLSGSMLQNDRLSFDREENKNNISFLLNFKQYQNNDEDVIWYLHLLDLHQCSLLILAAYRAYKNRK